LNIENWRLDIGDSLDIPDRISLSFDHVTQIQNESECEIDQYRGPECQEGGINEIHPDLAGWHTEFSADPGAYPEDPGFYDVPEIIRCSHEYFNCKYNCR